MSVENSNASLPPYKKDVVQPYRDKGWQTEDEIDQFFHGRTGARAHGKPMKLAVIDPVETVQFQQAGPKGKVVTLYSHKALEAIGNAIKLVKPGRSQKIDSAITLHRTNFEQKEHERKD